MMVFGKERYVALVKKEDICRLNLLGVHGAGKGSKVVKSHRFCKSSLLFCFLPRLVVSNAMPLPCVRRC